MLVKSLEATDGEGLPYMAFKLHIQIKRLSCRLRRSEQHVRHPVTMSRTADLCGDTLSSDCSAALTAYKTCARSDC
jgi:hypothetical protein